MAAPAAVLNILVTANTKQATASLTRLNSQMGATAATANRKSAAFGRFAKGAGLALGAVAIGATKMASDFNQAMQLVETQAGAPTGEVEKLRDAVLDLAKKSEFSPTKLAQGLFRLESAGFRGEKAMRLLDQSQRLAAVGQSDLEATTRGIVAAMKSQVKGTKDVTKVTATLNAIVGQGNMRMDDLVAGLGTGILPSLKSAGIGLNEYGAALGVMTEQNMSATSASTRFRMVLGLLGAPTDEATKAFQSIGLTAQQVSDSLAQKGLGGTIEMLARSMEGLSEFEKKDIIRRAFGGARTGAFMLGLIQNVDSFNEKLGNIDEQGVPEIFEKAFGKQAATESAKFKSAMSAVQVAMIQIGTVAAPVLASIASFLADNTTAFMVFAGAMATTVVGWYTYRTAVLAAKAAVVIATAVQWAWNASIAAVRLAPVIAGLAMYASGLVAARTATIAATVATMALNVAMRLLPWVALATAVALAAAAIIKNWGAVKNFLGNVWGWIKDKAEWFGRKVKFAAEHGLLGPLPYVISRWRQLKDFFVDIADKIKRPIVEMTKPIGRALQWIVDKVKAVIDGFQSLKDKIPDAPEISLPGPGKPWGGQTGGIIVPGSGTGDKVPAMLEPGEVVWNRKAVAAMGGVAAANEANKIVPRFAKGGAIGRPTFSGNSTLTSLAQSGTDAAWKAGNTVIAAAKKASQSLGADKGNFGVVTKLAQKFGNVITSGFRPGDPGWHGKNRARDYAGGNMLAFAREVAARWGKNLLELIHTPLGFGIKNGARVAPYATADHYDHVHVALQRGGAVRAARAARKAGWRGANLIRAVAEAGGESTWRLGAVGDGGASHGPWQIHKPSHPWLNTARAKSDWDYTARAAHRVWKTSGRGFDPWHAPHAPHMAEARKAVAKIGNVGTPGKKTTGKGTTEAKAVELPAKLQAKVASWTALADKYSEWADRAGQIEDRVYGKDEAGWLRRELQAIFTVRNILVAAYLRWQKRIKSLNKRIQKLKRKGGMKKHGKVIKALRSQRDALKQRQGLLAEPLKELQGTVPSGVGHRIFSIAPPVGTLGGRIFDIQAKLKGLGVDTSTQDGESADLLRQLLRESQLRNLISERQFPTLSKIPEIVGSYAKGGPIERTGLAEVHRGEYVIPRGGELVGSGAPSALYADIYIGGEKIAEHVKTELRHEVSMARRRTG